MTHTTILPTAFTTAPWKNGGGVTHEIAKSEEDGAWLWRLSIAEVATDGPFSAFPGLSRILTVIEGEGLQLHLPDQNLSALPDKPVAFSGDVPVTSTLINGPIRDFNVIYDATKISATVEVEQGPTRHMIGSVQSGILSLAGLVKVDGQALPVGAFALGTLGALSLGEGAKCIVVRLRAAD